MKWFLFTLVLLIGCENISEQSVVRIFTSENNSVTGFFISKSKIITVTHTVIDDPDNLKVTYVDRDGVVRDTLGVIEKMDKKQDFMIIRVEIIGSPVKWCDTSMGHPVRTWGWLDEYEKPEFKSGIVLTHWSNKYTTTSRTTFGYSGGPVVADDCVIGMHVGKTAIDATYAVHPKNIGVGSNSGIEQLDIRYKE